MIKKVDIVIILFEVNVSSTSIFGINPRNGGRPPIDIRSRDIEMDVYEFVFFHERRFLEESVRFIIINRMRVIEIIR